MSSVRLNEHRQIRIVDIADIQYMPDIYLRRSAPESAVEPVALLTMVLTSGERIRLEGKPATEAWEDFNRAAGASGKQDRGRE